MKIKDVPIPPRMAHLEKDRRGYPIPANVLRDIKGEPAFTVNDTAWVVRTQIEAPVPVCGICGTDLEIGDMHFLGGPASAFHPQGVYLDGPVHEECGQYALMVCPYLALPRYAKRLDAKGAKNPLPIDVEVDWTQYEGRPTCFVMGRAVSFSITNVQNPALRRFHPVGALGAETPISAKFVSIQVWKEGQPVEDEQEMIALIQDGLKAIEGVEPQAPKVKKANLPKPSKTPCGTCPYRQDVPSGIWHEEEYLKLPSYDKPLEEQAAEGNTALFYCHQKDGHLCAGWVGCHDMEETLAARCREVDPSVFSYESPIPLFASGQEACDHGMAEIENPSFEARVAIDKLMTKREQRVATDEA